MNHEDQVFQATGRCACGQLEYRLNREPLFVHCCHCSWCQRETGSAFAVNALIESEQVEVLKGSLEKRTIPSNSGSGQTLVGCPECQGTVWSHYGAARKAICFVRVGTLDRPDSCSPDIHIYTSTRQAWVQLADDIPVMEAYYRRSERWPATSIARYAKAVEG